MISRSNVLSSMQAFFNVHIKYCCALKIMVINYLWTILFFMDCTFHGMVHWNMLQYLLTWGFTVIEHFDFFVTRLCACIVSLWFATFLCIFPMCICERVCVCVCDVLAFCLSVCISRSKGGAVSLCLPYRSSDTWRDRQSVSTPSLPVCVRVYILCRFGCAGLFLFVSVCLSVQTCVSVC